MGGGAVVVLFLLILIVTVVVLWILSAKTYVVARTASGTILSTGTSLSERQAAEELYSLILNESLKARHRPAGAPSGQPGWNSSPSMPTVPRPGAPMR